MIHLINKFLRACVIALFTALVISVTWQVLSRYALSSPSAWTEEVARIALVWLGFVGAAYAHAEKAHLGIDLLEQRLPPRGRETLGIVIHAASFVFAGLVLLTGGAQLTYLTWELRQTTAVLGLPMAFVYAVIPASGLIICLNCYLFILKRERSA